MDRRTAVKNMLIVAGGMVLIPSCLREEGGASIELSRINVSAKQEDLLADLVEALIPKTDTPGAKDLNLHLFVMKMVDDCQSPEDQEVFLQGLTQMNEGKKDFEAFWQKETEEGLSDFAKLVKNRAIQGYMNSEYVMKNELIYELIPGRYNGAYKIDEING